MNEVAVHPAEINGRNQRFWATQSERLNARLEDAAIRDLVFNELENEEARCPVYYRLSLEALLERAVGYRQLGIASSAKRAAKARRPTTLQVIIERIVEANPMIPAGVLASELTKLNDEGREVEIDKCHIWLTSGGERIKAGSPNGLKDRLTRAKKKIAARKAK